MVFRTVRASGALDDAIAWIECRVERVIEAGDHDVVIGDVVSCETTERLPLVYYEAEYRGVTDLPGPRRDPRA